MAQHSNLAMPQIYTWVAFYSGNEGSLLYIAFALSALSALALFLAPTRIRDSLPYTNAVLMVILAFFLAVMVFMANPFAELSFTPADGEGINPLLTHPGMFVHPPGDDGRAGDGGVTLLLRPWFPFGGKDGGRMGRRGAYLGHNHLGPAGYRPAPWRLVGLYHPGLGWLLGLGPGGERRIYAPSWP